jgi:DNA polymerase-1
LAQADARVVAWDADDEILKEIFNDPKLDLHTENAKAIFGSCPTKDHPNRKRAKAGVHAVNYNVYPATLAATLGITVLEAETFINKWFGAHPKIKEWHQRIYHEMMVNKRIENAFGYGKTFFDARDKPTALSEALAWIPQSTVGNIINFVWAKLEQLDQSKINVMMQVHDSLVFQIRHDCLPEIAPQVQQAFASVVVPYKDPLVISSTLGLGYNCGEVDDVTWDGWVIDPSSGLVTDRRLALWPAA